MKKFENKMHVEGYIFSHNLENRVSQNTGKPYIRGNIQVATDETGTNLVDVNFSYVGEFWGNTDKVNGNYAILQQLIDAGDGITFEKVGTSAQKIRIDGNAECNDFVSNQGEMVSAKRFAGSFVHLMSATDTLAIRPATFDLEVLIYGCIEKEVDEGEDYIDLNCYAFNFRGDIQPITVSVRDKGGIKYFLDKDISKTNPMLTKIWGDIVSNVVKTETTVENAFGAPTVNITSRTFRAWNVIGTSVEPMDYDDEGTLTKAELKQAVENREVHLADVKARKEQSNASNNAFSAKATPAKAAAPADDDFPF